MSMDSLSFMLVAEIKTIKDMAKTMRSSGAQLKQVLIMPNIFKCLIITIHLPRMVMVSITASPSVA